MSIVPQPLCKPYYDSGNKPSSQWVTRWLRRFKSNGKTESRHLEMGLGVVDDQDNCTLFCCVCVSLFLQNLIWWPLSLPMVSIAVMEHAAGQRVVRVVVGNVNNSMVTSQGGGSSFQRGSQSKSLWSSELEGTGRKDSRLPLLWISQVYISLERL